MKPQDYQTRVRRKVRTAVATLGKLMKDEDPNVRLRASIEVLDRAYGKAPKTSYDPWIEEFEGVSIDKILGEDNE